jgi:hypothetical protein
MRIHMIYVVLALSVARRDWWVMTHLLRKVAPAVPQELKRLPKHRVERLQCALVCALVLRYTKGRD